MEILIPEKYVPFEIDTVKYPVGLHSHILSHIQSRYIIYSIFKLDTFL